MATVYDQAARPQATPTPRSGTSRPPGVRSTPTRQRRLPWIALGVLLVFGAGLAFAAWSRAASVRVPVLVAARDVAPGEVLSADAVSTVEVGAGPGVRTVAAADRTLVLGQVARGPIPAGTLLSPDMVADGDAVPPGQAVVGALLAPGAYPTAALRAGDHVLLVEVAGVGEPSGQVTELGDGEVWAVTTPDIPGGTELFVSLLVPADRASAAADAAGRQQLRLVLVGGAA
jgi:hypothetical protein